jgi:lipopolysaccharide transport system ATP-binding protein
VSALPRVEVAGVAKKFCQHLGRSLRYGLVDLGRALAGVAVPSPQLRPGEFWALSDVSFELAAGECLGVIGPNGAGKSTLVRLLNGRLTPDAGTITVRGPLAAISELGVGFDPLLTGRENVLHNATLLGMAPPRAAELLERILDFAEIGSFADAPVLTYSSGMRARLGYAVAAHLSPDTLLIDEVLSVGDLAFRRKCVQHVLGLIAAGKSLLLVSHDLYVVQTLCTRVLYLEQGRVVQLGEPTATVSAYLAARQEQQAPVAAVADEEAPCLLPGEPVAITGAEIEPLAGEKLRTGEGARVTVRYRSRAAHPEVLWAFRIASADLLLQITSGILAPEEAPGYQLASGDGELSCRIPRLPLMPGTYALRAVIAEAEGGNLLALHGWEDAPTYFQVVSDGRKLDTLRQLSGDLVALEVEAAPERRWPSRAAEVRARAQEA